MLRCTRCECIKLDRAHHCRYCINVITYEPIVGYFLGGSPGKYNFVWGLKGGFGLQYSIALLENRGLCVAIRLISTALNQGDLDHLSRRSWA